ncbi:MAG TPA: hypothetical protein VJ203_09660 [Bacteroidales bacterium]|nr:hypothetical protein [Bacteroidales bacterium]
MDELKNIAPKLSRIKKDHPFEVPDHYFEDFRAGLQEKIQSHKKDSFTRGYAVTLKPYLIAAVIVIVALVGGNVIFQQLSSRNSDDRFRREISQVVEQELYSISEEIIFEAMEVGITDENHTVPTGSDEMIDYLLNADVEEELLNSL